jgi:hypothetical protein
MTTSTNTERHTVQSDDGTERLDIEVARNRVKALASNLVKLATEANELSSELQTLLSELDRAPMVDVTEPHQQGHHE